MKMYLPIFLALTAFFFLFIGIKVILSKRPMFVPSKYYSALTLLALLPLFIHVTSFLFKDLSTKAGFVLSLNFIMLFYLVVFLWKTTKGYTTIGVSDDSFRNAIHFSLKKINQPFEEKLSMIELTSIGAQLQIAINSGGGTIELKKSKDAKLLSEIIAGLNEYYLKNNIRNVNNIIPAFYIIAGLLMIVVAGISYSTI